MSAPHPIVLSHELHASLSDLAHLAGQLGSEQEWTAAAHASLQAILDQLKLLLHRVEDQQHHLRRNDPSSCLDLPLDEDSGAHRAAVPALDMVLDKQVLVVEDDPDCRLMIAAFLMSRGMRVNLAVDGAQALATLAEQRSFDLILMDLDLPVLNGVCTARGMREQGFSGLLCAMSAGLERYPRAQLDEAGFNEVLAKPLDFRHLLGLLAN